MFELTISADFAAAHCLPAYPGKCCRLHGHNWRVDVTVAGNELDENGMLVDFHILKTALQQVLATLDHHYLNEVTPFTTINPTAECIGRYIYQQLAASAVLPFDRIKLVCVKVWESPHAVAVYRPEG